MESTTHPTLKSWVLGGGFQMAVWHSIQSHQILMAGSRTLASCGNESSIVPDCSCSPLALQCSCRIERQRSRMRLNICRETMRARSCSSDRYPADCSILESGMEKPSKLALCWWGFLVARRSCMHIVQMATTSRSKPLNLNGLHSNKGSFCKFIPRPVNTCATISTNWKSTHLRHV